MANQNDIYRVLITGTILGELHVNSFWYRLKTVGTPDVSFADDLLQAFRTFGWQPLMAGFSDALDITLCECINWADLDDYSSAISTADDGQQVGSPSAPSNIVITFSSNKPSPGKFYSYHRISGIPLNRISGNTISDTTTPSYQPFAAWLPNDISVGSPSSVWEPVQVKHSQKTAPYTPENPYKIPNMGSGNPIVQRVLSGPWSWKMGSQNSRKPGYGD